MLEKLAQLTRVIPPSEAGLEREVHLHVDATAE